MIDYEYILSSERRFRAMTNMKVREFKALIPRFESELENIKYKQRKNRIRKIGGGAKPKYFTKPSRLLLMVLFYIRAYPTYDLMEIIFRLDKANINRWIKIGFEALEKALGKQIPLPAKRVNKIEELFELIPELKEHIIDATEQPINRPKNKQEKYYSGKKKRHTIKRQIIITPEKKIISIGEVQVGKAHDKTIADESYYLLHAPQDSIGMSDLGYQGISKCGTNIKFIMPIKKKRKIELQQEEKNINKAISSIRVRVEHVIAHLKYNRIFSDKVRYRTPIGNQISNIIGGLYNFKNFYLKN